MMRAHQILFEYDQSKTIEAYRDRIADKLAIGTPDHGTKDIRYIYGLYENYQYGLEVRDRNRINGQINFIRAIQKRDKVALDYSIDVIINN